MNKVITSIIYGLFGLSQLCFAAPKIPKFSGYSHTSTRGLIGKTKFKNNTVNRHDGYEVRDTHGNVVSYVDKLEKPKHRVDMVSINGEMPNQQQLKNINSQIYINKICFKCR